MKKNLKWIILIICITSFLMLTRYVFHEEIIKADIIRIQNNIRTLNIRLCNTDN